MSPSLLVPIRDNQRDPDRLVHYTSDGKTTLCGKTLEELEKQIGRWEVREYSKRYKVGICQRCTVQLKPEGRALLPSKAQDLAPMTMVRALASFSDRWLPEEERKPDHLTELLMAVKRLHRKADRLVRELEDQFVIESAKVGVKVMNPQDPGIIFCCKTCGRLWAPNLSMYMDVLDCDQWRCENGCNDRFFDRFEWDDGDDTFSWKM